MSMRLTAIKPGDIVHVNKKGRLFYAKVVGAGAVGTLRVQPLERNISYRHVTANEIVDHWSHNVATRRADRRPPAQTMLDLDDAR
jgi:NMD protein affecting ribosome stability and mRNA decay